MTVNFTPCALCGLPAEVSAFELVTINGVKTFCCEGCLGIYMMLHDDEVLPSGGDGEKTAKSREEQS